MALPEFKPAPTDFVPAPAPITAPLPHAALSRLPQLHEESRMAMRRAGLLSRAVPAAGALLMMGVAAALLGGGELAPTFFWSLLVLGGIGAVLVSHLRTVAVFKDMAGSAADLRAILLYLGAALPGRCFQHDAVAAILLNHHGGDITDPHRLRITVPAKPGGLQARRIFHPPDPAIAPFEESPLLAQRTLLCAH